MDRLDQVLATATPLLRQVDELLSTAGAPAGHALWAELRRVRLLPGDAVRAVAALSPSALTETIPELRAGARACAAIAADLPAPDTWTGEAAEAYDDLRRRTAGHLAGADDSLDERLEATADLGQALADWMTRTRSSLAATLADVLISGQAVTLSTPAASPPETTQIVAAADLAAHLLRAVADSYADATDLLHGSTPLTTAIPL
jgi:ABC-type transporter Mla subunit MlaD